MVLDTTTRWAPLDDDDDGDDGDDAATQFSAFGPSSTIMSVAVGEEGGEIFDL
jgi:hypothetical protein